MKNDQTLEKVIFRIARDDKRDLRTVAERLDLKESEVGRRAMRLGLQVLKDSELPGARLKK